MFYDAGMNFESGSTQVTSSGGAPTGMGSPLTTLPRPRFTKARCPICGRPRHLTATGLFVSHGPGPDSYLCAGSGVAA